MSIRLVRGSFYSKLLILLTSGSTFLALYGCGTDAGSSQPKATLQEAQFFSLPYGRAFGGSRNLELKKKNFAGWFDTIARGVWYTADGSTISAEWYPNSLYLTPNSIAFTAPDGFSWTGSFTSCSNSSAAEEVGGNNNGKALLCSFYTGDKVLIFPKREDRLRLRFLNKDSREIAEYEVDARE